MLSLPVICFSKKINKSSVRKKSEQFDNSFGIYLNLYFIKDDTYKAAVHLPKLNKRENKSYIGGNYIYEK
jgi:hypothetical protein